MDTLKIKNLEFAITSASISEAKDHDGNTRWSISVKTGKKKIDGHIWQPSIQGENMLVNAPSLAKIIGKEIYIKDAYNHKTDEYLLSLYIFEHEDIWDSRIQFISREMDTLKVQWTGRCNIHWNEEYSENIPFQIDANLEIIP